MSVFCLVMHILCVNSLKLLSGFFWDKVWLSWWGEVGNPASVLISLGLKFVDNDVVLLWSHHAGKLLLLVIDTTACTHARRSHNRRNIHGTTRYVRLCGKSVWYCCARAYARGVGVKTPSLNLLCYKNVITYAMEFVYVFVHFLLVWCQLNAKTTEWFCLKISRNTANGPKRNIYILVGIWVIACIQKPSHHFLQTSRRLRIFMLVLRDSSLYS